MVRVVWPISIIWLASAIPGVLGPAGERDVVIVCDGRAGYCALPVRIRRPECRIGARLQSAAQRVRYAGTRILPPNGHLTPNDRTELRGVRQLQTRGRRRRGHVAVILDGRPARRGSLLRLDQDHAV